MTLRLDCRTWLFIHKKSPASLPFGVLFWNFPLTTTVRVPINIITTMLYKLFHVHHICNQISSQFRFINFPNRNGQQTNKNYRPCIRPRNYRTSNSTTGTRHYDGHIPTKVPKVLRTTTIWGRVLLSQSVTTSTPQDLFAIHQDEERVGGGCYITPDTHSAMLNMEWNHGRMDSGVWLGKKATQRRRPW